MCSFVTWCNQNAGFFSLLLSVIAVITSVFAVCAQNKSAVFKERLSLYCTALDMFQKSCRIVEICKGKSVEKQKKLIALIMFEMNSVEQDLIEESFKDDGVENTESSVSKFEILTTQYADLYIEKYMNDSFVSETEIFFKPIVCRYIKRLYRFYDNMRLGILGYEQDEIDTWLDELDAFLKEMQKKHILKKMKRKLPL